MASEQANFNQKIQDGQNNLKEPLEIEISKIRQEGDLMMRELERTQNANRELMQNVSTFRGVETPSIKFHTYVHPSTAVSSTRARKKHNQSMHENFPKQAKIRHSTPSTNHIPMSRLKRFKMEKSKDDSIPDFSFMMKERLAQRVKNKSVLSIL